MVLPVRTVMMRNLDTHMKEQIRNTRHKSAVAAHAWEESHRIEEAKLLKHIQNLSELTIWGKQLI